VQHISSQQEQAHVTQSLFKALSFIGDMLWCRRLVRVLVWLRICENFNMLCSMLVSFHDDSVDIKVNLYGILS